MSILDRNNRSITLSEANEIAMRESEGRLSFIEDGAEVIAIYWRCDSTGDAELPRQPTDIPKKYCEPIPDRRIAMPRTALNAWGIFEMARAAGPRPERMVHGRANRSVAAQPV